MLKHNKKKNAGIVYEQLVALTTRLAANKQHEEARFVLEVIKKHFGKGTALGKERKLFTALSENLGCSDKDAQKLLEETLNEAKLISEEQLEKEKLKLIESVSKNFSSDLFNIPLKKYKDFASIQILFNEARNGYKYTTPKERVKIQNSILKKISFRPELKEQERVDNLTYKIMVNKFNKKYSKLMNEDQKEILKGWLDYLVNSDSETFNKLIESKLNKVKLVLSKHMDSKKHDDSEYKSMLKEAYSKAVNFQFTPDEEKVYEIMRYFDVCEDLEQISSEETLNG